MTRITRLIHSARSEWAFQRHRWRSSGHGAPPEWIGRLRVLLLARNAVALVAIIGGSALTWGAHRAWTDSGRAQLKSWPAAQRGAEASAGVLRSPANPLPVVVELASLHGKVNPTRLPRLENPSDLALLQSLPDKGLWDEARALVYLSGYAEAVRAYEVALARMQSVQARNPPSDEASRVRFIDALLEIRYAFWAAGRWDLVGREARLSQVIARPWSVEHYKARLFGVDALVSAFDPRAIEQGLSLLRDLDAGRYPGSSVEDRGEVAWVLALAHRNAGQLAEIPPLLIDRSRWGNPAHEAGAERLSASLKKG